MSTLVHQLEQLKRQQEVLEKRIQEEEEAKKILNNESSIERLEKLVEPITETLDFVNPNHSYCQANRSTRLQCREDLKQNILEYNRNLERYGFARPVRHKNKDLENEEIFVTLIGILKKHEKRIEYLESRIKFKSKKFVSK